MEDDARADEAPLVRRRGGPPFSKDKDEGTGNCDGSHDGTPQLLARAANLFARLGLRDGVLSRDRNELFA